MGTSSRLVRSALLAALVLTSPAAAQTISFETFPNGSPTTDQQVITNQYASYGVTFTLLDRTTGLPIGSPRIAKAGPPLTAFEGCTDADTPIANMGLGSSFLTDGAAIGVQADLRIEYATAVSEASGVILDVDCRIAGGPPCEQWTVTAYDGSGTLLQTVVLDAPQGAPNAGCLSPGAGPGDAKPMGWALSVGSPLIRSIVLRYTGSATPTDVGLAFDNFSVANLPGPPDPVIFTVSDTVCMGEFVDLTASVAGGLPPYSYQWQQESAPGSWTNLGTSQVQTVHPAATTRYRVIVSEGLGYQIPSAPRTLIVNAADPLCTTTLLVSSGSNDRVLRYRFRGGQPEVLVATGSGGLNGPSGLVCRPDGAVYVVSQLTDQVMRYDGMSGAFGGVFVTAGSGGLNTPVDITAGTDGNLYVVSYVTDQVLRYSGTNGAFMDVFVPATAGLNGPTGLTFGPDGHLYVASRDGDKIMRFDGATGAPLGTFVTAGSGGLDAPRGITFGPDGHLYVGEEVHHNVRRFDGATGAPLGVFVAAGAGGLDRANDVAFGPDGNLYVASYNSNAVLAFDGSTGAFLHALPSTGLAGPSWLAVGCGANLLGVGGDAGRGPGISLAPGAPNPFRGRTVIEFTLPEAGHTSVAIMDVSGRVVRTLADGAYAAGRHTLTWDARNEDGRTARAGVYFVRVKQGAELRGQKLLLVK